MTTFTSNQDGSTDTDSWYASNAATNNYGAEAYLCIGEDKDSVSTRRSVLKFDLSSIPSNATVSSAILSLWLYQDNANNTSTVGVYRLKRAWVEAQVTWNIWKTSNNWSTAGGFHADDCEQTTIGTLNLGNAEAAGEKQWSLNAAKVQEWISGAFANNGILMKTASESDDLYLYRSSEYATGGQRPKLVIEYTQYGVVTIWSST